jgi:hypothetical protein
MIRDDCKYWQRSCDLCGITGDDHCKRKCKDYDSRAEDYMSDEDWDDGD